MLDGFFTQPGKSIPLAAKNKRRWESLRRLRDL
jgi:hypothetical protein